MSLERWKTLAEMVPDSDIRTWVGPFWDNEAYLTSGRVESERLIAASAMQPWHHCRSTSCLKAIRPHRGDLLPVESRIQCRGWNSLDNHQDLIVASAKG